ncbi:putative sam domain-containing protein [Erysiphe neolycopersici]|uniref:Putative sam domain-containing protein n=1 Tax=Erysiphe neolycopersici TaxID=212602 RepID=A0A420I272_9PEZI|nr:putative sam domain-containing protein [Erysiphe neolycopersici]
MVFESGTAFADSDAEEEHERSLRLSPVIATDSEVSPTDSDGLFSNDHTPTTYGTQIPGDKLPENIITQWTADECADFVSSLGLHQYGDQFLVENDIVGEALVALQHDELKQMGVNSVGHRLTILKSVYDIKVKQEIPIENDHYVPLSAEAEGQSATATLKDIKLLVEQLQLRDERMTAAESELRRITFEYARLREDLLPVFRMAKEGKPLPYLSANTNGYNSGNYDNSSSISPPLSLSPAMQPGISRNYSTKKFFIDQPKNLSPTYAHAGQDRSLLEQTLDQSAAPDRNLPSYPHLSTTNNNNPVSAGNPSCLPSPTSPQLPLGGSTLGSRSYRSEQSNQGRSNFGQHDNDQNQSTSLGRDNNKSATRRIQASTIDNSSSGGSVEIFKSFRVSMDDPCYKVLPAALKKYNINAPWEQYALYIVYGDNERCLDMDEKPLILFKQLDKEGKKPMFMLRKIAPNPDQIDSGNAGLDRTSSRQQGGYNDPPGGII